MKNFEKYKTSKERYAAFCGYECECANCKFDSECGGDFAECALFWLELEADEEDIMSCPYCGGKCSVHGVTVAYVSCDEKCGYESRAFNRGDFQNAIAAHNRVARAVMEYEKKEAGDVR